MSNVIQASTRQIFVGNLSNDTTEETLFYFFLNFGTVIKVKILRNEDGSSKHSGFVTFKDPLMATVALSADGNEIDGRKITCLRPTRRNQYDTPEVPLVSQVPQVPQWSQWPQWSPWPFLLPAPQVPEPEPEPEPEPVYLRRIFVANLPNFTTGKKLEKHFERFGEIEVANIFSKKEPNVVKWYGFVIFEKERSIDIVQRCRPHRMEDKTLFTQRSFPTDTRLEDRRETTVLMAFNYESNVGEDDLIRYFQQFGSLKIICRSEGEKTYMMFEFDDYDVVDQLCLKSHHQLPWGASFTVTKCHEHFFQNTDGDWHIPFEGNTLTFFNWRWLNNSINPDIRIAYSHDEEEENRDDLMQAENAVTGQAVNVPRNIAQVQGPSVSGQWPRVFQQPFGSGPRIRAPRENFGASQLTRIIPTRSNKRSRACKPWSSSQCAQVPQQSSLGEDSSVSIPSQTPQVSTVQDQTTPIPVKSQTQASIEADEEAKILKIFLERLKASTTEEITAEYRKNKMFNEFYEQRDQLGKMAPLLSASEGKIFVRYLEKTYFSSKDPKGDQEASYVHSSDQAPLTEDSPEKWSLKAASSSVKKDGQETTFQEEPPQSSSVDAASSSCEPDHSRNVTKESRNDQTSEAGPSSAVQDSKGTVTEKLPRNPSSGSGQRILTSQRLPQNPHTIELPAFSGTGAASSSIPTNWTRMLQQIQQNPPDTLSILPSLDDFISLTLEDNDREIPGPTRRTGPQSSLTEAVHELATLMATNQSYTSLVSSRSVNPLWPAYPTNQSSETHAQNLSRITTTNQDEQIDDQNEVIGGKPKWVWNNIRRNFYNK